MTVNPIVSSACFAGSRLSNALDLLLIKLGGRCFGLPLPDVRHICSMPTNFTGYGPDTETHFVYQGNPVPYASLWNQLGVKSEYLEYEEMLVSLPMRRQDHLDWMDALEIAIRNGIAFTKSRNPRECAFGKWYYGYHPKERRLAMMIAQFEEPHAKIHALADRLLALAEIGQRDKALEIYQDAKNTTLAELMRLFDYTQDVINALLRRTAVIVIDGDEIRALGTDGVRDIVAVPADRITQNTRGIRAASALVVLDEQNVVPLIDWRKFFFDRETSIAGFG